MIYKFTSITKKLIWGEELWALTAVPGFESKTTDTGKTLAQLIEEQKGALVGEDIYARYGNEFPLLIKFITAKQDLSIQVHPADEYAKEHHNSLGKNEMWYILDAEEDTRFHVGFNTTIDAQEYEERVKNDTIMQVLNDVPVAKGDVIYLPAGRVHSIGGGSRLLEVQQSSDITYRIYDYNRLGADGQPRQLHTEQARDVLDYKQLGDAKQHYTMEKDKEVNVVESPYFTSSLLQLSKSMNMDLSGIKSFSLFICSKGSATLRTADGKEQELTETEVALVPATETLVSIEPNGAAELMHVTI